MGGEPEDEGPNHERMHFRANRKQILSMTKFRKMSFIALGSLFVLLGLIGILIPVLPTTPFLLLAAYFYARSSDRALHWLLTNRWFGGYIRNYREGRGMSLRDKVITIFSLWATIAFTGVFLVDNLWVRLLLAVVAAGVTTHLVRINTYRPEPRGRGVQSMAEPE